MLYKSTRERAPKTMPKLAITNHRDFYWLEPHCETYESLMKTLEKRALTEKEQHLLQICVRALRENHMVY